MQLLTIFKTLHNIHLALLGFCNVYALRVNLSVALVAMVAKSSTLDKEGKMVEVSIRTYSTSAQIEEN